MAATGFTPISLYYSTTASSVPLAANLANGELALNIADMKLYAKNGSGVVTLLASNASTAAGVDSLSFGTTGLTPSTATTGAITVAGTLNVANGGTGLTSLTANRIPYGNGTSAFQSSGNLTFDGTRITVLYSGASGATFGGNQAIRIDSSANTGYAIGIPSTGGIVGGYYINSGTNSYDGGVDYNGTTRTLFLRSAGAGNVALDSSGNLGLGVTPSAWSTGKAFEIGHAGNAIFDVASSQLTITQNAYYNGGYKYGASTTASRYDQGAGSHIWYNAPSGTAGNPISFTTALTLDTSSNLTATGSVTAYSDERLKKDWSTLPFDFIERLAKVKSGTYTRIDNEVRQAGSSAQDWQTLLPEVVLTGEDKAKTLSLAYGNAALVSVIELAKRFVALEAEVTALKGTI